MSFSSFQIYRYILFSLVVIATIYFLFLIRSVLLSFLMAGLLAYLLYRPVKYIESKGLNRTLAILILYVFFIGAVALLLYFAIPGIVRELGELGKMFPEYAHQAQDMAEQINHTEMPGRLQEVLQDNIKQAENFIYSGLKKFLAGLYGFLGKIFAIIFSPILAFYIMNDWEKIRDGLLELFPPVTRRELIGLFNNIDKVLIEFFKGYLMVAAFVGASTGLAALLLGVKFPLLLGILSGVTNLIPYFGAFIGGIPAVGIAMSDSLRLAAYMVAAIIVIQQVESNLITPNLIGSKLGIHPLVIVFALLAGGQLWGIWGMLFAVPIAAVLKVVLGWAYLKLVS